MPWIPITTIASSAGVSTEKYHNMRKITKNQNRFAWVVAVLISLFVFSMVLSGIASAESLMDQINSVREKPVKKDVRLEKIAMDRCVNLTEWSHAGYYQTYSKLIEQLGYRETGEILAMGFYSDKDTFNGWRNSPSHNQLMTSKLYSKAGIVTCYNPFFKLNVSVGLFGGY